MMKKLLIVSLIALPSMALAQQPDPTFLQHAVTALQSQRNAALDAQAVAEAKIAGLTDDLAKANQKVKELNDKLNPPKTDDPKKK
jgi:hypothetical protein